MIDRPAPASGRSGITRAALLVGLLGVVVLALVVKMVAFPRYVPCESCKESGAVSCGATGCEGGRVPCTGPCLKKDTPGWIPKAVPGHPPDLLWMEFIDQDGSRSYFSQNHLGEVVENDGGKWVNRGACPACNRTGRMACPSCQGKKPCSECGGTGKLRRAL